jgi:multicomponent K+:H+ antiporter subunit E
MRFSLTLLITWLLLANSVSPGQLLLGALLGVLIPLFTRRFWPEPIRLRRPLLIAKFTGRLLTDIVLANLAVARVILHPQVQPRARFVHYPLALGDELAITILANTITLTPGTVAADLSADRTTLLIHCLDVADEAALIEQIKTRYETLLQEIFAAC